MSELSFATSKCNTIRPISLQILQEISSLFERIHVPHNLLLAFEIVSRLDVIWNLKVTNHYHTHTHTATERSARKHLRPNENTNFVNVMLQYVFKVFKSIDVWKINK